MVLSTLLYICIALTAAFLLETGKKNEGNLLGVLAIAGSLLILAFFAAIRFEVGTDYHSYVKMYGQLIEIGLDELERVSPVVGGGGTGVWLIAKAASMLSGVTSFFGLFQLLTALFFYLGLRSYDIDDHFLPMFIYVLAFYPMSLNIIKQALAAAIVFYALRYVYERKSIWFIIFVIAASAIHRTAVVYLPIYVFYREKGKVLDDKTKRTAVPLTIYICTTAACLLMPSVFSRLGGNNYFFVYITYAQGSNNISFILHSLLLVLMILLSKHIAGGDSRIQLLLSMAALGAGIDAIGYFSYDIKRMSIYFFSLPSIVLLSCIYISFLKKDRMLIKMLIMSGAIVWFIVIYAVTNQGGAMPYKTIWQ